MREQKFLVSRSFCVRDPAVPLCGRAAQCFHTCAVEEALAPVGPLWAGPHTWSSSGRHGGPKVVCAAAGFASRSPVTRNGGRHQTRGSGGPSQGSRFYCCFEARLLSDPAPSCICTTGFTSKNIYRPRKPPSTPFFPLGGKAPSVNNDIFWCQGELLNRKKGLIAGMSGLRIRPFFPLRSSVRGVYPLLSRVPRGQL